MINHKNNKQKLAVINPDAAGIDVGSREHYVCVPAYIAIKSRHEDLPLLSLM